MMAGPDRRELLAGLGALAAAPGSAVVARKSAAPISVDYEDGRMLLRYPEETVEVSSPFTGVASVFKYPPNVRERGRGFFARDRSDARIERHGSVAHLIGDGITVLVDTATGLLRFETPAGVQRIQETASPDRLPGIVASRSQGFRIGSSEALRGLGQFRDPLGDYRDRHVFLAQANSDSINPFLLTTGGWGLLWDNGTAAHMVSNGTALDFHSTAGRLVRYHVCLGADADELIGRYRVLTGPAALLPKWAYGYWQSKERYASQVELVGAVREFRRRRLPLDAIVLDWRYWGEDAFFSGMRFDPQTFPDPPAMVRAVHEARAHLLASIWPAVGPGTDLFRELSGKSLLMAGAHWSPGARVIDFTSADARRIYWRHVREGLIDIGVDGLWSDGNEPEFRSTGDRYLTADSLAAQGRSSLGNPWAEDLLTFSWRQAEDLSRRWRRHLPGQRPVLLTRKAYSGQAAFGAVTWSGDTFASWGTLSNQIVAARQVGLSGLPWWTCDIGGFTTSRRYPGGLADPAYRELYVRWFQFGAFLPVFRAHGTDIPREPWQFGEPGDATYDAIAAALRQRYALKPYIYSMMARVALDHDTPLRDLIMDYPDDPAARAPTQFMFGRDLLVHAIDRPFEHFGSSIQELIPNYAVTGIGAPAATLEYYEGASFERRIAERLTDDLKMSWAGYLPEALAGKPYSCRWTGQLTSQESGVHRLVVTARGRVRLTLDGNVILTADADGRPSDTGKSAAANGAVAFTGHEGDRRYEVDVILKAGEPKTFRVELRQPLPDAVSFWFEWITPSQAARMSKPARSRLGVHLPQGSDWYELEGGARHPGGTVLDWPVTLQRLPVFARSGAVIPMCAGTENMIDPIDHIELHVYAGADGGFVLYDDAGDGSGYLKGEHIKIAIKWLDKERRLLIGSAQGDPRRLRIPSGFSVVLHDGARPLVRKVDYDGTNVAVALGG